VATLLTDAEKQRVAYHLGFPAVTTAASIQFGLPALTQTNFLVYGVLDKLLPSALDQVRSISLIMDNIETQLISAQGRLRATKLEELTLRGDETDALESEYRRWGYRLSDVIGSPVYPFSRRYMGGGANSLQNVAVRRDG
jgi:hypothetical protein